MDRSITSLPTRRSGSNCSPSRRSLRAGSVPELLVENMGDIRVLFIEGEELVGAKQNRILNTSILVAAKSKTKIPVSCVEQGRWGYKSKFFGSSGSHSPSKLRYALEGVSGTIVEEPWHPALRPGRGVGQSRRASCCALR